MEANNDIILKIKILRLKHNLTQEQFAELIGVSKCTIVFIETKRRKPSIATLVKISKAFDIDINELLKEEDKNDRNW